MPAGSGLVDLSETIADARNVLLVCDGGAILCHWHEPGVYEIHVNFLASSRGRHAAEAALAACRWMFTRTDCMTLLTRVPSFNRGARALCVAIGGTLEFERKGIWPAKIGETTANFDISFWSLSYEAWIRRTKSLAEVGRAFHARLDEEFARHGKLHASHPDEECHDRYAGACVEMIHGGQPEKGVALYNRWARFAGYGSIGLASKSPLLVDIGDALLQATEDHSFKVVKCR